MKKETISKITSFVGTVVIIIAAVVGGITIARAIFGKNNGNENEGFVKPSEENHSIYLTINDIETELRDIAELMTYEYYYSGTSSFTDYNEVPFVGWDIPLTDHEIKLTYAGTIKVGYDLSDMEINVDNEKKTITIALGEQIIENNLPEESVETIERNNILNLIRSDEVTNRLVEIKNDEYEDAVDKGIKEKAEDNAKAIIEEKLSGIDGYTIYFI